MKTFTFSVGLLGTTAITVHTTSKTAQTALNNLFPTLDKFTLPPHTNSKITAITMVMPSVVVLAEANDMAENPLTR